MTVEIADILRWHRRYGWTVPPGEWGEIQDFFRHYYRQALDEEDVALLSHALDTMFQQPPIFGLVTMEAPTMTALLTGEPFDEKMVQGCAANWYTNMTLWQYYTGASDIERLRAPNVGNPVTAEVGGVSVMVDTPRHDHYAERIVAALDDTALVADLGGGYGGLALQLLRHRPTLRVALIDLPPTLYLAGYWLSRVTTARVGWWDEDATAQIVLVPALDIDAWAERPALVFAAHSLSEMGTEEVARYMAWIRARAPAFFYHDNAIGMPANKTVEATARTFPEVFAEDMDPGPPYVLRWREAVHWALSGKRYEQFFYARGE